MTGSTLYSGTAYLNHITGGRSIFPLPSVFLALFTSTGTDLGSGFTEPAGNGYIRMQVSGAMQTNASGSVGGTSLSFGTAVPSWITTGMYLYDVTSLGVLSAGTTIVSISGTTISINNPMPGLVQQGDNIVFTAFGPASGAGPSTISNAATITTSTPSGTWGTLTAFGLYDQASLGNLLTWDYLGAYNWLPVTVTGSSPAILTAKNNGYMSSDTFVYTTEYGGQVPVFIAGNFTGLLTVQSPTTDTFTAKNGATVVNTSSTGSGAVRKVATVTPTIGTPLTFAGGNPGALQLSLA
jgi:hypothetical protein